MKLQMKREGLEKMNRLANEMTLDSGTGPMKVFGTVLVPSMKMPGVGVAAELESALE
jgi:hypothetical protein